MSNTYKDKKKVELKGKIITRLNQLGYITKTHSKINSNTWNSEDDFLNFIDICSESNHDIILKNLFYDYCNNCPKKYYGSDRHAQIMLKNYARRSERRKLNRIIEE